MEQRNEMEARMDGMLCEDCKVVDVAAEAVKAGTPTPVGLENEVRLLHDTIERLERQIRLLNGENEGRRRLIRGLRHTIDRLERTIIGNAVVIGNLEDRIERMAREHAGAAEDGE